MIHIDAERGTLDVALSQGELDSRKARWQPPKPEFNSGYIWKYAQQVGPARDGAVTHPGATAETSCYADI
jgi:dihydroxy-acid dehydratase